MSERETFLVTGAAGCIGAWVVRQLVEEQVRVVAFDLSEDVHRLQLIMSEEELARVTFVRGDVTDLDSLAHALDEHAVTNVIHLAALQVPFARANPPLGARVNVVGTVNVLEAVADRGERIERVVYSSSIGIYDAADADPVDGRLHTDAEAHPHNHYGVFKLANEGNARVYWADRGLRSIGLRPMTVYGPGRDQGLTSGPTKAILAAVVGRPFEIAFGGRMLFQYVEDVARTFIAASRCDLDGARLFNLPGSLATVDALVQTIEDAVPTARGLIRVHPEPLPFPEVIDSTGIELLGSIPLTTLGEAVHRTAGLFRDRFERGALVASAHGLEA